MRYRFFILSIFLLNFTLLCAQRIKKNTFQYIESGAGLDLEFDIYHSEQSFTGKPKPAFLYVHGGGFSKGRRDRSDIVKFCKRLAQNNIVAISMSYTLSMKGRSWDCDFDANSKIKVFRQLAEEITAATKRILTLSDQFTIDTSSIFLAGSSAGAEGVLELILGNENYHLPDEFTYAGYVSMAGAVAANNSVTSANAIPALFFHGSCDTVVPFSLAPHHYCEHGAEGYLTLKGPMILTKKLDSLSVSYRMIVGCGDGHEWAYKSFQEHSTEIINFIEEVNNKTFFQEIITLGEGMDCHSICRD